MKLLIDAHVHIYPNFNIDRVLELVAAKAKSERAGGVVLCLTERSTEDFFATLSADSNFQCLDFSGVKIGILQGSQIKTAEKLEVLWYGERTSVEDGLGFEETLEQARKAAPLFALPWGLGKWWGRRGVLIKKALQNNPCPVCDSAMRPSLFPKSPYYKHASKVLLGSDPLPSSGEEENILRCGMYCEIEQFPSHGKEVLGLLMEDYSIFGSRRGLLEALQA